MCAEYSLNIGVSYSRLVIFYGRGFSGETSIQWQPGRWIVAVQDSLLLKLFGRRLNHHCLDSKPQKAQTAEKTLTLSDSIDFGSGFLKAHTAVAVSWFFSTSECALHSRFFLRFFDPHYCQSNLKEFRYPRPG